MKKLALAFTLAVAAFGASAEVLNFEEIPFSQFPANADGYGLSNTGAFGAPSYGNFGWSADFKILEAAHYLERHHDAPAGNGFVNSLVSGSFVAFNGGAAPVSFEALSPTGLFNFNSVYMGAAWYNGLQVDVTGYRDGVAVYNTRTGPLGFTAGLVEFNWSNIDKVSFASVDGTGTVIDNASTYNHAFVMDNLSVSAVPEPETYAMMLAGLGLIGGIARRRRKDKQA